MDQLITALTQFGIGGLMAAVMAWFLWHLVAKTIPEMTAKHSADLLEQRKDFLETLRRIEDRSITVADAVVVRMERIDDSLTQFNHTITLLANKVGQSA